MSDLGHKIENPLFLFSLFEKGVYCLEEDVNALKLLNNNVNQEGVVEIKSSASPEENVKNVDVKLQGDANKVDVPVDHHETPLVAGNFHSTMPEKKSDIPNAAAVKQTVKVLNLFFDPADNPFNPAALEAYPKLMQAIKLDGQNLQLSDFGMLGIQQSPIMKSLISENGISLLPEIWKEFNAKYVIVWTNRKLIQPEIEHFLKINFAGVELMVMPSFSAIVANVELKKRVWLNIKQHLGFV